MASSRRPRCCICGEQNRAGQTWFLVLQDAWLDRLKILRWNDRLAAHPQIHFVCSPAHIVELVAHWMVTASVAYPLLSSCQQLRTSKLKEHHEPAKTPEISPDSLIGELAVHRESLERALRDHPEGLSTILSALLSALECAAPAKETEKKEEMLTAV
jgi:hypothetical protein